MLRILGLLLLLTVVGYGLWPYYTVLRVTSALEQPEAEALAPYVDLPALRSHYQRRVGDSVDGFVPAGHGDAEEVLGWLAENLKRLGDAALEQAITLGWVQETLRQAVRRAAPGSTDLLSGIDFAFFESWDRFVVRLGALGDAPTFVVLSYVGGEWLVTDITG